MKPSDYNRPSRVAHNWEELVTQIRLTDGGVYDNLGLQPVWDDYKCLISSDGGGLSPYKTSNGLGNLMRYQDLLQDQIANLRRRMLMERISNQTLDFNATTIRISKGGKPMGYSTELAENHIATIRTDLNRFTESEARVLENHGYTLAEYYLKTQMFTKEFDIPITNTSPKVPFPEIMDEATAKKALKHSKKRFSIINFRPKFN